MPESTIRKYRCDDDVYTRATTRAAAEGTDVSKLIRQWLGDYAGGFDALAYRPAATPDNLVEQLAELVEQLRTEIKAGSSRRPAAKA
jgi:hypothetical protein